MRRAREACAFLACLFIAWLGAQETGAQEPGAGDVGLAIGKSAPKFTLPDQNGTPRSLDSFLGGGDLAIVFFRSADW